MRRVLLALVLLTLTYAFALASFHPWDLVVGAVISGVLLFVFRRTLFGGPEGGELLARIAAFVPFAAVVIRDIMVGTWEVSLITFGLRPLQSPGTVVVPIGERTPVGVTVSALCTTLSPGAFLVDVDRERGVMFIHVIDASDPEAVREQHQRFYRRYQRRVFP